MEVWQVGMFLGPAGADPVIRGSRHLQVKSDESTPGKPDPSTDKSLAARIAAHKRRQQEQEAGTT